MGLTFLLDGKTSVSGKQLALNMIKAALLANEEAGVITFEVQNSTPRNSHNKLIVVPTGNKANWPVYTLEYRLVPDEKSCVSDIVKNWIQGECRDPWNRAVTLGKIMLTLRGYCKVFSSKWRKKKYLLSGDQLLLVSQDSLKTLEELLDNCKQHRAEIWNLLDKEITGSIKSLKKKLNQKDYFDDEDPWLNEAAVDRDRLHDQLLDKPAKIPAWIGISFGILIGGLLYYITDQTGQSTFTLVTLIVVSVFVILFSLPIKFFKNLSLDYSAWVDLILIFKGLNKITGIIIAIPLLTLISLFSYLFTISHLKNHLIFVGLFYTLVSFVLIILFIQFQSKIQRTITSQVVNETKPQQLQSRSSSLVSNSVIAEKDTIEERKKQKDWNTILQVRQDPERAASLPVKIEIITADNIQSASDECIKRLEAVKLRNSSTINIFRKGILFIASSTFFLSIAYTVYIHRFEFRHVYSRVDYFLNLIPIVQFSFFVLTVIICKTKLGDLVVKLVKQAMLNYGLLGDLGSSDEKIKKNESLRIAQLHVAGAIWAIVAIENIFTYSHPPKITEVLFIIVSLVCVATYLFWMHRKRKTLEKLFPYNPPLNLLALRVFGSSALNDFLELSNSWQWIGTRQSLDGPDTTGYKMNDLINYLKGRINSSIVKDESELQKAYTKFRTKPDRELRFAVNSMQCSNATWKQALQKLLDAADAIVVDLSDLAEKNPGIAYEIGKLINEISLQRIVFLVNNSTDRNVLNDILIQAWNNMSPDSPNRIATTQKIVLFSMGGLSDRYPNESVYKWKSRQNKRMNETSLVGLLYNAAQPARNPVAIDQKRDVEFIKWTRFPMPELAHKIIYVGIWIYIIVVSIRFFIYLSHFK